MNTYHDQARLLKLMAHPMRLQILDLLRCSEECVCHLSAVLNKPQPYVSQQLAILREAGLILDRKEGTNVFYGLDDSNAAAVLTAIFGSPAAGDQPDAGQGHQQIAACNCPKCCAEA